MLRADERPSVAMQDFQAQFRPFYHRDELERLLPKADGDAGNFRDRYIYLEPPDVLSPDSVVLLDGQWRLGGHDEFRLRLGIFVPITDGRRKYGFAGYRFETPEGPGDHNFWHAQPINSFGGVDDPNVKRILWYPTSLPAFPLFATDIVQLLACAVIALKGMDGMADLDALLASEPTRKQVKAIVAGGPL